jgi:hypothetical protein
MAQCTTYVPEPLYKRYEMFICAAYIHGIKNAVLTYDTDVEMFHELCLFATYTGQHEELHELMNFSRSVDGYYLLVTNSKNAFLSMY